MALSREDKAIEREMRKAAKAEQEAEDNNGEHPGLKGYSRIFTQVKHVAGGTLKGALIGGGIGAAVFAGASAALGAGALMAGGPFTLIPAAIMGAFGIGTGFVGSVLGGAALSGATVGGLIGGGGMGLMAITSAGEAADAEEEKLCNKADMADARARKMEQLRDMRDRQVAASQRQETQMRGVNPNRALPGRGAGMGNEGAAVT